MAGRNLRNHLRSAGGAMTDKRIQLAEKRAQVAIVDAQIRILQDAILRFDAMIDECAKLRNDIEKRQASA